MFIDLYVERPCQDPIAEKARVTKLNIVAAQINAGR
jgi:hypothetical protein